MRLLVCLMAFIVAGQAFAEADHGVWKRYSPAYRACSYKTGGSYTRIMRCEQVEIQYQDHVLNETYTRIMRKLPPDKRLILRNLEREWILLRDNKCPSPSDELGLSGIVDALQCRLDETIHRTLWLERYGVP